MSRQSIIDLMERSRRRKSGLDFTWRAVSELLREQGQFTTPQLLARVGREQRASTTRGWLAMWARAGYLTAIHQRSGKDRATVYSAGTIRTHTTPRVRRDGTILPEAGQERLWRAMKILKTFTVRELAAASAADDATPVPEPTANTYVVHLRHAGIVALESPGAHNRYRLARNLGGAAPKILATRAVYDPNSGKIVGNPVIREASS